MLQVCWMKNQKQHNDQVSESPVNKSDTDRKITKGNTKIPSQLFNHSALKSILKKPLQGPAKTNARSKNKVSYSDGNYILVYSPDGEYKRVSYKLADMVHSLHETDQSAKITKGRYPTLEQGFIRMERKDRTINIYPFRHQLL